MSDPSIGIVPRVPFIPEQPPTEVIRTIIEWKDRADLSEHSFDGQWRVLVDYRQYGIPAALMERWVPIPDDPEHVWMEHCVKRD